MGEVRERAGRGVRALRLGLDLGMTLIDTAEMYADGARRGARRRGDRGPPRRGLPRQQGAARATPRGAARSRPASAACERLRTDRIDLYLLHWRGRHPLAETVEAFRGAACSAGKIRHWGVSNFDVADMDELVARAGGGRRDQPGALQPGPPRAECELLPWCREHGAAVMAYSPIDRGALVADDVVRSTVAARHGATPAQVALAWVLRQDDVVRSRRRGSRARAGERGLRSSSSSTTRT